MRNINKKNRLRNSARTAWTIYQKYKFMQRRGIDVYELCLAQCHKITMGTWEKMIN
jgi:hypothetical protein